MIKNKDGSYNTFRLSILFLMFIIIVFITGVYIFQNINFQKIELPLSPTPTPNVSTVIYRPVFEINTNFNTSYNGSSTSYNITDSNWSWSNTSYNITKMYTNISWVAPDYVGSGGSGGSYDGSYSNSTYLVIAGGGGSGGIGYTAYINSTPIQTIITPQETSNLSQNISQIFIPISNSLNLNTWTPYILFGIPIVLMMLLLRRNSFSTLMPIIMLLIIFGYIFNIDLLQKLAIIGAIPLFLFFILSE